MMKNYLLLTALDQTGYNKEEIKEALEEFGCDILESIDHITGKPTFYATCKTIEGLSQMAFNLMIPGNIIEYTAIYDSKEEETITELS